MTAVGEKHVPIASAIRGLAHKISLWLPGIKWFQLLFHKRKGYVIFFNSTSNDTAMFVK
jgi:hypothetical protein